MNIALIGYGKMGHILEALALERGHRVVCIIDRDNPQDFASSAFAAADVAIEFTTPATAEANIRRAWSTDKPVVCGTTGWQVEAFLAQAAPLLRQGKALVWSSNYSIGVNILFALNRQLAAIMRRYPQYKPAITEVHHVHKLDAPSGTAKTLAEQLSEGAAAVPITSVREGEVAGIHTVQWESDEDTLSIRHEAKSRRGFALGAMTAAEWIIGKQGFHTLEEILFTN